MEFSIVADRSVEWWELAGGAAAVVSIAGAVVSWMKALASARQARNAEERAREAEEARDDLLRRHTEAVERSVALQEIEAARLSPPWVLRWRLGSDYQLVNDGDKTVYDVQIDYGDVQLGSGPESLPEMLPRSSESLTVFSRTAAVQDDTVKVTWRWVPEGPRFTWKMAFPYGPR